MESRYRAEDAPAELLALRCYTSRLLGAEPSLVLHGGGNTSVKGSRPDFFGDPVEVLWVKGSGWDLAAMEPAGLAPVRMSTLLRMADLDALSDVDMVREQRAAMLDPSAPDPSVEAILHAIVPHCFVDHTHSDAVVTLTNAPDGEARIRRLYGDRVLVIPYVMPGFVLAREVRRRTRDVDWSKLAGMVLMHHGLFTFGDDARVSYERTIALVHAAEAELSRAGAGSAVARADAERAPDLVALAAIRREVSRHARRALVAVCDDGPEARGFALRPDAAELATRGPVTPDHVIRTKRVPVVIDADPTLALHAYAEGYAEYFARHDDGSRVALDPAPRWAVWKGVGTIAFGTSAKAAAQVADIARHSLRCFQWGEALGGWRPLGEKDLFDMEYWELEQRKLRVGGGGVAASLAGRVALITGGASGIGRAVAERLRREGAAVCVLDRKASVAELYRGADAIGIACDVTESAAVSGAVGACVRRFGGLDVVISNAGDFPPSRRIEEIDDAEWEQTLALNLSSHMKVIRAAASFLALGIEPAIVVMASRNVPAPGPGAAAYSVSKAGLTQLARVAALELAPSGVRVNVLHPDKVFDTELWSDEKIALRARSYGLGVDEYKRQNMLRTEVTTADVAEAALALVRMRATTGAQVPIDGGSDRVV